MKPFYILALFYIFYNQLHGQQSYELTNKVYDDWIKTVTFEVNNSPTGFPIIRLQEGQFFMLKFDDLLNEERNFYYRIIHCDKDWTQSAMREIDYINGFQDERLRNYEYSVNTRIKYIHYWQQFPNKDFQFKISGNYILYIYEDNVDTPILTRRFVIAENTAGIELKSIYPSDVLNIRYKQEVTANVSLGKLKARNPMEEVSIGLIQNDNWDSEIFAKPSFLSGSTLRFTKLKTFDFWGLAEYREFDTRSLFRLGRGIEFINRRVDGTDITLQKDSTRANKVHLSIFDFNGRFFVDNADKYSTNTANDITEILSASALNDAATRQSLRDSILRTLSSNNRSFSTYRVEDRDVRSDYTEVNFLLDAPILLEPNQDIYILGSMNNWQPIDEYKMKYDGKRDMFDAQVLLKQGYYNYYYGVVEDGKPVDYQALEGSWNETENDYRAFIYYRGLGDLYDRVIGYGIYNTNSNLLKN